MSEIGGECPSCKAAGKLIINDYYVQCDNCDYQRFSTQSELDNYVNPARLRQNPTGTRLLTLIEEQPFIAPRQSEPLSAEAIFESRFSHSPSDENK